MKPPLDFPLNTKGFRDRVTIFPNREEVVDTWVAEVLGPTRRDFEWQFVTHEGVYKSSQRFFSPYTNPPKFLRDLAEKYMEVEYGSLIRSCHTKPVYDVTVNWGAAAGPLADGFARELRTYMWRYPVRFDEFWEKAHVEDWPMYWKSTGKVEFLPSEKVAAGIPRTFVFPDGPARLAGLRITQDFNKKMLTMHDFTSSAVGCSLYNGGWDRVAASVRGMKWFGQCDASKWDARYGPKLHSMVSRFRRKCHAHPEPRLDYIYRCQKHALVFLPSGELIQLAHGQPSGQWSTTPDNTLVHSSLMWVVGHLVCLKLGIEPTMGNILRNFLWKVYGDDLFFGCSDLFHPHLEQMVRYVYDQFGFVVKPGAFLLQEGLDGVEFLGGKFGVCQATGQWCYVPNPEKLLESAVRSDQRFDEGLQHDRCLSFFILGFHTSERERFQKLYYAAHRRALLAGFDVPDVFSEREIEAFIHGLETDKRLAIFVENHEPLNKFLDLENVRPCPESR